MIPKWNPSHCLAHKCLPELSTPIYQDNKTLILVLKSKKPWVYLFSAKNKLIWLVLWWLSMANPFFSVKYRLDSNPWSPNEQSTVLLPLASITQLAMEQRTLKNVNRYQNTKFSWRSTFVSMYNCCSLLRHRCKLDLCGCSRQPFSCIGVYYIQLYCEHF